MLARVLLLASLRPAADIRQSRQRPMCEASAARAASLEVLLLAKLQHSQLMRRYVARTLTSQIVNGKVEQKRLGIVRNTGSSLKPVLTCCWVGRVV